MSEREEAKEILKQARDDMFEFREILGFPVLRRPLIMLREQMKLMTQIRPQVQGERQPPSVTPEVIQQLQSEQPQPPARVIRETLPRLPLPLGLRERVERIKLMPIRTGVGEVLRAYSTYISSPRQRKREEEKMYEERQKDLEDSKMAQERLRRHGGFKEHGIEM